MAAEYPEHVPGEKNMGESSFIGSYQVHELPFVHHAINEQLYAQACLDYRTAFDNYVEASASGNTDAVLQAERRIQKIWSAHPALQEVAAPLDHSI